MGGLLLHIGTGKTGSTALQSALRSQAQELTSAGIGYPFGPAADHNALEALVLPPERWHRVHRVTYSGREAALVAQAEHIANAARQAQANGALAVLSSEYLYSLGRRQIAQLLERVVLPPAAVDAVMYVRQPSSYVLSGLQQFLKHEHNIAGLLQQTYSFADAICNWSAIIGRDRLHVRAFSRQALTGGDIAVDLADFMASRFDRRLRLEPSSVATNSSMSSEECIVLQEAKRSLGLTASPAHRDHNVTINRRVRRAARRTAGLTRLQFNPGLAGLIDANHEPQLRVLLEMTGIDFGIAPPSTTADTWEMVTAETNVSALLVHDPVALAALRRNLDVTPSMPAAAGGPG